MRRAVSCGVENPETIVVDEGNSFRNAWMENLRRLAHTRLPRGCDNCIDISMNVALTFISRVLRQHPDAEFSVVES